MGSCGDLTICEKALCRSHCLSPLSRDAGTFFGEAICDSENFNGIRDGEDSFIELKTESRSFPSLGSIPFALKNGKIDPISNNSNEKPSSSGNHDDFVPNIKKDIGNDVRWENKDASFLNFDTDKSEKDCDYKVRPHLDTISLNSSEIGNQMCHSEIQQRPCLETNVLWGQETSEILSQSQFKNDIVTVDPKEKCDVINDQVSSVIVIPEHDTARGINGVNHLCPSESNGLNLLQSSSLGNNLLNDTNNHNTNRPRRRNALERILMRLSLDSRSRTRSKRNSIFRHVSTLTWEAEEHPRKICIKENKTLKRVRRQGVKENCSDKVNHFLLKIRSIVGCKKAMETTSLESIDYSVSARLIDNTSVSDAALVDLKDSFGETEDKMGAEETDILKKEYRQPMEQGFNSDPGCSPGNNFAVSELSSSEACASTCPKTSSDNRVTGESECGVENKLSRSSLYPSQSPVMFSEVISLPQNQDKSKKEKRRFRKECFKKELEKSLSEKKNSLCEISVPMVPQAFSDIRITSKEVVKQESELQGETNGDVRNSSEPSVEHTSVIGSQKKITNCRNEYQKYRKPAVKKTLLEEKILLTLERMNSRKTTKHRSQQKTREEIDSTTYMVPSLKDAKEETNAEVCVSLGKDSRVPPSGHSVTDGMLSANQTKGNKFSKSPKHKENMSGSQISTNFLLSERRNACEEREETKNSFRKREVKAKKRDSTTVCLETGCISTLCSQTERDLSPNSTVGNIKDATFPKADPESLTNEKMMSKESLEAKCHQPRSAWVCCDDCHKWRSIPAELADIIGETNCKWTCKDNIDKSFADCSISQVKSNSEINLELGISDDSDDNKSTGICLNVEASKCHHLNASKQALWTRIKHNQFLHRNPKIPTIDEVMVCQCKPPLDSSLGCGDECLNRILNIECSRGTCPCGEICSNQQFQKRKYAKLKPFYYGKKGHGLQIQNDVRKGTFIIEYVGEVLDLHAYEVRQREYASQGQKHFYFMTLNGTEVIDACAKGNLSRFINHCCEPNCQTEKWVVNGEVCVGLFAIKDIKKGEEVTFDYNYVRVYGAAAKKCVCGAPRCRGYIGGNPLTTEAVVQDDSDDGYSESLMISEDREKPSTTISDTSHRVEICLQSTEAIEYYAYTPEKSDKSLKIKTVKDYPLPVEVSAPAESKHLIDSCQNNIMSVNRTEDKSKSSKSCLSRKKSHRSISSKKERCRIHDATISRKIMEGIVPNRLEGVEEKLRDLLDASGGIIKKKDSAKGYLKLLLVTATSGDSSNGEIFQSTRDLSIILEALLKTKSRSVLLDIINKNGLLMLHNIMKQNQKDFNKTPIIRKLLKVLEFLATKEVLTRDHINMPPPHTGMESFKDSIIALTRHNDTQVHQIARAFRDKWIYHTDRKVIFSRKNVGHFDLDRCQHGNRFSSYRNLHDLEPQSNTTNYTKLEMPSVTSSEGVHLGKTSIHTKEVHSEPLTENDMTNGTKRRKRKSRWDYPADIHLYLQSMLNNSDQIVAAYPHKMESCSMQQKTWGSLPIQGTADKEDYNTNKLPFSLHDQNASIYVNMNHEPSDDVAPPGFSSLNSSDISLDVSTGTSSISSSCNPEVVTGNAQMRFLVHLPVSYGVPLSLAQKLGTRNSKGGDSWKIAPGLPFYPFPPLPPYPREGIRSSSGTLSSSKYPLNRHEMGECQPSQNDVSSILFSDEGIQRKKRTRWS